MLSISAPLFFWNLKRERSLHVPSPSARSNETFYLETSYSTVGRHSSFRAFANVHLFKNIFTASAGEIKRRTGSVSHMRSANKGNENRGKVTEPELEVRWPRGKGGVKGSPIGRDNWGRFSEVPSGEVPSKMEYPPRRGVLDWLGIRGDMILFPGYCPVKWVKTMVSAETRAEVGVDRLAGRTGWLRGRLGRSGFLSAVANRFAFRFRRVSRRTDTAHATWCT